MAELTMGGNVDLAASSLRMTLSWAPGPDMPGVDVSALLLTGVGKVAGDTDFVFYNQPEHPSGAVRLGAPDSVSTSAPVLVDLGLVPAAVDRVVICSSVDSGSFGHVAQLTLSVADAASGLPLVLFPITAGPETAILAGEVYRRGSGWKFRAIGQGYANGLAGLAADFGVAIDAPESAPPPQVPPAADNLGAAADTREVPTGVVPGRVQLIPGRVLARKVPELGMRCDADDTPGPLSGEQPVGCWHAAAVLDGVPGWSGHTGPGERGPALQGMTLAVTRHRVFGIFGRFGVDEQVWFSLPLGTFTVRADGQQGTVRRRPQRLELSDGTWTVHLEDVERVWSSGRYQRGQEQSLFDAVTAAPAGPELEAAVVPAAAAAGDNVWVQAPQAGVFVHTRSGTRTGRTCLVDPEAELSARVAHLKSLTWLPENIAENQAGSVLSGAQPADGPVPAGRLHSPVGFPFPAVTGPDAAADPVVRGYLWPRVDSSGALLLEDGESLVRQWSANVPRSYWVEDDLRPKAGGTLVSTDYVDRVTWTLTDRRVAFCAAAGPAGRAWVFHLRFEWVCGVSVEEYRYAKAGQPGRRNVQLVAGDSGGRRLAVWLSVDDSSEPVAGPFVDDVMAKLTGSGRVLGQPRERVVDNGKKGVLTWRYWPVDGHGPTIPAAAIGL